MKCFSYYSVDLKQIFNQLGHKIRWFESVEGWFVQNTTVLTKPNLRFYNWKFSIVIFDYRNYYQRNTEYIYLNVQECNHIFTIGGVSRGLEKSISADHCTVCHKSSRTMHNLNSNSSPNLNFIPQHHLSVWLLLPLKVSKLRKIYFYLIWHIIIKKLFILIS